MRRSGALEVRPVLPPGMTERVTTNGPAKINGHRPHGMWRMVLDYPRDKAEDPGVEWASAMTPTQGAHRSVLTVVSPLFRPICPMSSTRHSYATTPTAKPSGMSSSPNFQSSEGWCVGATGSFLAATRKS
jgi:hypothetical protein